MPVVIWIIYSGQLAESGDWKLATTKELARVLLQSTPSSPQWQMIRWLGPFVFISAVLLDQRPHQNRFASQGLSVIPGLDACNENQILKN